MERQLKILEQKVEEKKQLDRIEYYQNNIRMFNITRDFVKEKNLLLYGGLALNLSLPHPKRFYDEYEVPDYDFFSPNALKHGKELANLYAKRGYTDIELKPGLHEGTYKLFVNYTPIADITAVPRKLYAKMMEKSSEERDMILRNNPGLDLHIAPLDFLRMSLHLELSRPNGFIDRWSKIYSRMVLFYKTYPLKYESCLGNSKLFYNELDENYHSLVREIKTYLRLSNYPAFGSEVLKMYIREGGYTIPKTYILDESMTAYDIISEEYEKTTKELEMRLKKMVDVQSNITVERHSALYNSELIPHHFLIKYKNKPLVAIYQSQACYAFKERKGMRIATIDACLSLMYGWLLSNREYYNKDKVKCAINIMLNLQKLQLKKRAFRNKIFSPFEIKCYGYQTTLEDLKREKFTKNNKNSFQVYRPRIIKQKKISK